MFYAISKRRRDINAAEARGREIGRAEGRAEIYAENYAEGYQEIRDKVLAAIEARFKDNPDADPMAIIAELRAQSPNDRRPR